MATATSSPIVNPTVSNSLARSESESVVSTATRTAGVAARCAHCSRDLDSKGDSMLKRFGHLGLSPDELDALDSTRPENIHKAEMQAIVDKANRDLRTVLKVFLFAFLLFSTVLCYYQWFGGSLH